MTRDIAPLLAALAAIATLAAPAVASVPPVRPVPCMAGSPVAPQSREFVGRAFEVNRETGRFLLATDAGVLPVIATPEMVREVADGDLVAVEIAAGTSEAAGPDHCI
jgi:hypothetical protein